MKVTVTDELYPMQPPTTTKAAQIVNTGDKTVYWGWEPDLVASDTDKQGVPLVPGASISPAGRDLDLAAPIYFVCAEGEETTLNFTFNR